MAANVNIVVNAQDRASGTFRKIRNAFGEILRVALGIQLSQVLNRMGEAVRQFATNSIDAAAELQRFQIGIETLIAREQLMKNETMAVGDAFAFAAEMSGDYITRLQDIAIISPFQFTDVQKVVRQAMAFGFGAEEALSYAKATLNVAAGVGATNDMLRRMAYNLAQIRLQGKVTKLDIRQLALAGFDLEAVLRHVGDTMGVEIDNYKDFNTALNTGLITWENFTTGYADYADTYFGGASERMTRTAFGLKNTFKDVFAVTMPQILGPTLDVITDYASRLLDSVIELRKSGDLEAWGQQLLDNFNEKIKPVFEFLFYGKTDRSNPVVRLLNMFRHLKEEGFFGKTWEYIFEQMTGIDLTPLQNAVQLALDIVGALKDGGLLGTGTLNLMDQLFGLDEGTLASIRDTIAGLIADIKKIIAVGIFSDEGLTGIANLLGIDPETLLTIKETVEDVFKWFENRWIEIKPYVDTFTTSIKESLLPVLESLGLVLGYIAITILPILQPLIEKFTKWVGDHAGDFAELSKNAKNLGLILIGVVYVAFRLIWSVLEPLILSLADIILLFGDFFIAMQKGDWDAMGIAILQIIGRIILTVGEVFSGLIETIMQLIFGEDWTWAGFFTMLQGLREMLTIILNNAKEQVKTYFAGQWAEIITLWDTWVQPMIDAGDNLLAKWVEGAKAGWKVFTEETFPSWLTEIGAFFEGEWLTQFITSGTNLMAGIAQGFVDGFDAAKATFKKAIDKVIAYIHDLLKMRSPSGVFIDMGALSMKSYLMGFEPGNMLKMGLNAASHTAMAGAGAGRQPVVINNHYHGLTLNDRLQAETLLRPIVQKITR